LLSSARENPAISIPIHRFGPNDNHLYLTEDADELNEHAEKVNNFGINTARKDYEGALVQITEKASITFSSSQHRQRFEQILRTYLQGIRKRLETKEAMKKSFADGGAELDEKTVENILQYIDRNKDELLKEKSKPSPAHDPESGGIARLNAIIENGERDVPYDFKNALADRIELITPLGAPIDAKTEGIPVSNASGMKIPMKTTEEIERAKVIELETSENQPSFKPPQARRPVDLGGKKRMDDVMFTPKVMGPIDELRFFDLISFQRLNPEPAKAIEKIREKIELLGDEQYAKRAEGINAWRMSPLNKLYLAIGNESMSGGKSVESIIASKRMNGQECLSTQEFEAIMDLNKSLRF
jgi:hypothetical protein